MSADGNTQNDEQKKLMDSLKSRMKVQRVYNSANTLANLSDNLLSTMSSAPEIIVNDKEMDKFNEEIQALQDRLINAVGKNPV